MTDAAHPVLASDDVISALAERRPVDDSDPLLRALQAWVERIDAVPLAPWTRPVPACTKIASRGEMARRVAALTLALTLSSSGLATAVTGDPLSPLHFVAREFHQLGEPDTHRAPRWMDGRGKPGSQRGVAPGPSRSMEHRSPPPRLRSASTDSHESRSP
jgi:hypothetical protein